MRKAAASPRLAPADGEFSEGSIVEHGRSATPPREVPALARAVKCSCYLPGSQG